MKYRYKKSLVDKEQLIELHDKEISISEFDKVMNIPYHSIIKIHLKYNSSRYKKKEYSCKIFTDLEFNYTFTSKFYSGIGKFYDQGSDYRKTIIEFHKRASDNNSSINYRGGLRSLFFWFGLPISTAFLLLFSIPLINFLGIMGIVLPLIFGIKLFGYFYHNRPVKYNPVRIPSRLIPYE